MTQTQRVLRFIEENGSITTLQAFSELGITRLASRIHDLKKMGYSFSRNTVTAKNRYGESVRFVAYRRV